jgi:uncharacterized protein (DUF427 family)
MKAIWNGTVIAESQDTVIVEGNQYFPLASVNAALLEPSTHTSVCPWKGTANYYSLKTNPEKGGQGTLRFDTSIKVCNFQPP